MKRLADQVLAEREVRNSRRADFEGGLEQVRHDLEVRGVGGRIAEKIGSQARDTYDEAMDVAAGNKGVIAGTIAALMIWLFRNPIMAGLESLFCQASDEQEDHEDED